MVNVINDELKVYRGSDFVVSKHIVVHQPSLNEICDYGEEEYYRMVCQMTATPQSMKVMLWDSNIDYTTITPFELFYRFIHNIYPQDKTSILFGELDFTKFQEMKRVDDDSIVLCQYIGEDEVVIDEFTYNVIMDYLRQVHIIQKDEKIPANETTKMILIEDDREEMERNKNKKYRSRLKNLISAMVNSEGFKYNHSQVWDMKINAFMDSVKRISKIKNADLLLQSGYSGFGINLKDVEQKQIDWIGELD